MYKYNNMTFPAIDIHSHFNSGIEGDVPSTEIHKRDLPFLQKEYERLNVKASAHSTYSSVLLSKHIFEENERLFQMSQKDKSLFQWVVIDPRQPKLYQQTEELLKSPKALGIKIHSVCHEYPILDYADELFAFADEHNATLLMHPDNILGMVQFADKYPNMKLIIAHLGSVEHVDAIRTAKHGNILTDTSGGASSENNIIEYAIEQIGSDKILFGTDTYSCAFQKGRILLSGISEEDKRKLLYENALRLFPKLKSAVN